MKSRTVALALILALAACDRAPADSQSGSAGPAMTGGNSGSSGAIQGMAGMGGTKGTAAGGAAPIQVTRQQAALAGVTFAVARRAPLRRTVRAVAMAEPNERGLGIVNARVSGWVETLYVNETGEYVRAGQPLLALYAPQLVTAQEELLLAAQVPKRAGGDSLVAAARRRLRLWEISNDQIAALERTGKPRRGLTLRSPYSGNVLEKDVIEGQMVHTGDQLFEIADLSTVWIEPAIFEDDVPLVHVGEVADVTFDAIPGRVFRGRVTFLYPELDMRTRTLKVRIEIPNPDLVVKPMMYGTARIRTIAGSGIVVPLTAVLPTGDRNLAFVVHPSGVVPVPVVVGTRGDSDVIVTAGLAPGDTVVASATFLFDSESNLAAAMQGIMLNMGMGLNMGGMKVGKAPARAKTGAMPGMPMPKEHRP